MKIMSKIFDCQRVYEMESRCDEQCDHCKEYYKGKGDPLTSEDVIKINLLNWLKKRDLLTDEVNIIWSEYIKDNP
jgi:hypothetical protein